MLIGDTLHSKVALVLTKLSPRESAEHFDTRKVNGSQYSQSSQRNSSGLSSVKRRHSAKLNEVKVKLQYAQQEAELVRKEAGIKAERSLLKVKMEVDVDESNFQTIRKAISFSCMSTSHNSTKSDSDNRKAFFSVGNDVCSKHSSVATQRTIDFVEDQYKQMNCKPPLTNRSLSGTYRVNATNCLSSTSQQRSVKNYLPSGVCEPLLNLIVNKPPGRIQERWTNEASRYK